MMLENPQLLNKSNNITLSGNSTPRMASLLSVMVACLASLSPHGFWYLQLTPN